MLFSFIIFIIFLFGLTIGSFLNSVIYRLEKREGFLSSRSYCPSCKHTLAWHDLIPILSFIILRGKCRHCGKLISWQYPLVETATGLLFFAVFRFLGISDSIISISDTLFLLIITAFLIIIFVYDLKHYIIPDKVIYPAIAITFLYRLFGILDFGHWNLSLWDPVGSQRDPSGFWILDFGFVSDFGFRILDFKTLTNPLLSAVLASAFFLTIVLISRGRWMGVGDIKLAFLIGLLLGWPNILVALFIAFVSGAIIGIGLIIAGRKTLKSEVPFGPFLVAGAFFALFFGEKVIHSYLGLFLW